VQGFAKGDRVFFQGFFNSKYGTFQQYCLIPAKFAAHIPTKPIRLMYSQAASIPLCLHTAALGLYSPRNAHLTPPWAEGGKGKYAGQAALVFGGSSSTGQYAIQLLKFSGFSPIIATASLRNEALVKQLGADAFIDRSAPLSELSKSIASLTSNPVKVVYDAVSDKETQAAGYDILEDGHLLVVNPIEVPESSQVPNKKIHSILGSVHMPFHHEFGEQLVANEARLIEEFGLKWNPVEELSNGLNGIVDGLKRLENNQVSGTKLVALPQYTK
jgi:NADPH:quinone reductase-like Zn-dependent oxidoreductase